MSLTPEPESREPVVVVFVVVVVLLLVLATVAFRSANISSPSSPPKSEGPTFYQVLASLNGSVRNVSGGPWSLVSVIGIASPIPFSPNVANYFLTNISVNSCQQQFNGLTMWNGSLPVFDGTSDSGTAPFWQLGYYSEASQTMLIATSVSGEAHVYAPMPLASNCTNSWTTFRYNPNFWVNQVYANGTLPVDSSVAARVAWANLDRGWIGQNAPLAEVYALGPGMITGTGDVYGGNWEVYFMGCGVAGFTGIRPDYAAGVSREGEWGGALNLTRNCVTLNSTGPVIDRGINKFFFSPPSPVIGAVTAWIDVPYQVGVTALNGSFYGYYDGWGVANWMTRWHVSNLSGMTLPLGSPGCDSWVPAVSDCIANASGWYAVILSASGEWVNSYGIQSNGTVGWAEPVTAFVSHQQFVLIVPSPWNLAGDTLAVASTVNVCDVTGSITFYLHL
ncbi:MAG: hypothetical protein ABSA63_06150 [Thermoplasmata archaeon]|jgi:hypothetical protein